MYVFFDRTLDSYCSLISWDSFINNFDMYIEITEKKRENKGQYNITKRM